MWRLLCLIFSGLGSLIESHGCVLPRPMAAGLEAVLYSGMFRLVYLAGGDSHGIHDDVDAVNLTPGIRAWAIIAVSYTIVQSN